MNSLWKDFLESRSARVEDEGQVRFPNAPLEADCALIDLSHLGLIAISGPEAESFLQGQVTNDVTRLSSSSSQIGSHCSPKGRILASFRAFRLDDTIFLQLPRTNLETLIARLRRYLLRAKATLEDASEQLTAIALAGDCAPRLLSSHLAAIPTGDNGVTRCGDLIVIRIPGTEPRFEVVGAPRDMKAMWDALATTADVVNADYWALLDIRAGIPTVYPQTSDVFVPQMTNLQLLDGISFKKGCYIGQEVVARMQYLGKLKRRMYRARVGTEHPPLPGDVLQCPSSRSEQATGWVVDARATRDGDYELLVVVEIEAAEHGEVRLTSPDGPLLSFSAPPYGFPAEA